MEQEVSKVVGDRLRDAKGCVKLIVSSGDALECLEGRPVVQAELLCSSVNVRRGDQDVRGGGPHRHGRLRRGSLRGDATGDMRLPRIFRQAVAAFDEKLPAVLVESQANSFGVTRIEHQRCADIEIFDLRRLARVPQSACCEHHFQEARGRKNRRASDLVVVQPRGACCIELVFPLPAGAVRAVAEEGVFFIVRHQAPAFAADGQIELLELPRVMG